MTPLERAARAAKQALLDDPETDAWMNREDDPDDFRVDGTIRLTPVVRAVLQAIREPSEGMKAAAVFDVREGGGNYRSIFVSMIDAALAEDPA